MHDGTWRTRRMFPRSAAGGLAVVLSAVCLGADSPAASAAEPSPSLSREAPPLSPRPQSSERRGADVPLPREALLITGDGVDEPALAALRDVLAEAGVRVRTGSAAEARGSSAQTVRLGTPETDPGLAGTLRDLGARSPKGLPSGGYALASGRAQGRPGPQLALAGADSTGTYYAVQTLRQLLPRTGTGRLPSVSVRDWPEMERRGTVEGFYGAPWSQRDRLRQLDFYGEQKLNTYVYAPKDDPYHREKWRELYPAAELKKLEALNDRARARHVDFVYAVSPGLDVCYSDPADQKALREKAASLWDAGIRDFGIFFDDIPTELNCARDEERFGDDADPLAAAQAHLLNDFQKTFVDEHPGAGRLLACPTEYSGNGSSPYRKRFAELVADEIVLYWTGPEVVSPTIRDEDAEAAKAVFDHDLVLWDNYPVNDYQPRSLFLGPLTGRSRTLTDHGIVGLTANPMPQAEPSKIGVATAADYAWNPGGYRPGRSWDAALRAVGGRAADALRTFADNSRASGIDEAESARLTTLVRDFWHEHEAGGGSGSAAKALLAAFTAMTRAEDDLRSGMDDESFADQSEPWLRKLRAYGTAGAAAVRSLVAQRAGDGREAWDQRVSAVEAAASAHRIYESVAAGVMTRFLDDATEAGRVVTAEAPESTEPGSPVTLTAEVAEGAPAVSRVEFHAGEKKIGVAKSRPYQVRWDSPPEGRHRITARAVAEDGTSVTSAATTLTSGSPSPVLLLVGDDAPVPEGEKVSLGDAAVRKRLEHLGRPVTVMRGADAKPSDAEGKAAVVVSSTLASGDVGTKFTTTKTPVLTWEAQLLDDMAMADSPGETFNVSELRITDPGSPLAAGLSGEVSAYLGPDRLRWATPAKSAETAASPKGAPSSQSSLFGYRTGDAMTGGTKAPGPRVALFLSDGGLTPDVVTDESVRLFDASVRWALDGED